MIQYRGGAARLSEGSRTCREVERGEESLMDHREESFSGTGGAAVLNEAGAVS